MGTVNLALGIFLFISGLMKPDELFVPLIVGAIAIGAGISTFLRSRKNKRNPFDKSAKLLFEQRNTIPSEQNSNMKKALTKSAIGLLILLLFAAILFGMNNSEMSALLCAFVVLYTFMLIFKVNSQIKKTYESNELLKDITQTIEFYEKYFVAKSDKSETTVEYEKLYKVIENKTNFYLMIADNQGYIVSKSNCSQELIDFIMKLKKK